MTTIQSAARAAALGLATISAVAFSAVLWFLMLSIAGSVLVIAGTYLLAGTAWAFIASGMVCFSAAVLISRGMMRG